MKIFSSRLVVFLCALTVFLLPSPGQSAPGHEVPQLPELNWNPRSDWLDVRAAGAKGDGVADDTDAIQQLFDRLSDKQPKGVQRQHVVYFPPGKYRITRTLAISEATGGWLVGHGRSTVIFWDGEEGGRMFWSNGSRYVRYEGLTWDGRDKAAILVEHQSHSYYETWVRYLHCAFLNGRDFGVVVGRGGSTVESAELWFNNCLFSNCGEGATFLQFNDYDNIFDGCEFDRCGVGIHGVRGNYQVRGTRFLESRVADVKQDNISHACALRFCVSKGSRRFLEICGGNVPMPFQVEGCRVEGWTAPDGAISFGHPGPITLFDCVFEKPVTPGVAVVLTAKNMAQTIIHSSNKVETGSNLLQTGTLAQITEIPAGKRQPVLPTSTGMFFRDHTRIPGKVFDAKADFGAKGDGQTDDTDAIQQTIDAARNHGKDAIAYLPGGYYCISRTLNVTGSNYYIGGIGMFTQLVWKGAEGGVAIQVNTPQNVVLENFFFEQKNDTYTRIRHTATGASSILYDQVETSHYNDPIDGIVCENLPADAKVQLGLYTGKLRLADCGQAQIFALIHYGIATIEGAELPKTGFTGFMFHNAALPNYALIVRDNQDVVVADYYMEQSIHYLLCEGGKRQGKGHVTLGASKLSCKDQEAVAIRDYEGRVWISGGDCQWEKDRHQPLRLRQEGKRPVSLFCVGSAWVEEPIVEFGEGGHFVRLGEVTAGKNRYPLPNQLLDTDLTEAAAALDDFRQLGATYLEHMGNPDRHR